MFKKIAAVITLAVAFMFAGPVLANNNCYVGSNNYNSIYYGVGNGHAQVNVRQYDQGFNHGYNQGFHNGQNYFNNQVLIQKQFINIPLRVQRFVEVPNLAIKENIVVVRDKFGNIIDVRRQQMYDVQEFKDFNLLQNKVIIQENVIKGY